MDVIKTTQSSRKQDGANEGMSLAKYLAETVQSQAAEEHQSSAKSQEIMEVAVRPVQEKQRELEIEREDLKNRHEKLSGRKNERDPKRERERKLSKQNKNKELHLGLQPKLHHTKSQNLNTSQL